MKELFLSQPFAYLRPCGIIQEFRGGMTTSLDSCLTTNHMMQPRPAVITELHFGVAGIWRTVFNQPLE